MADATDAARTRLDRALAELERKVAARLADGPPARLPDDDLFATIPEDARAHARIAVLESAAREAMGALDQAAEAVRSAMRPAALGTETAETA